MNGRNKTQNAAWVVYLMRSWKKPSPFIGISSDFLIDTIKSTQRMILAPKIIHSAVVNGDKEVPDQIKNF